MHPQATRESGKALSALVAHEPSSKPKVLRFPASSHGAHRLSAVLLLAAIAAACASTPTCSATAQSSENADCVEPPSKIVSRLRGRAQPLFSTIPIDDPSGRALQSFHAALRAAEQKRGQARILIYGASHVAADVYPDLLRSRLQTRFGEAGPGFALPAKPLPHYRHSGLVIENSVGWSGFKTSDRAADQFFGLAGMYVMPTGRRAARTAFTTKAHAGLTGFASEFELYYWREQGGGHFKISIDGKSRDLSAAVGSGNAPGPAYERWQVPDGPHRVEVTTRGDGPVRIFGVSMERNTPGVIVDSLGIPGARAKTHLKWDDALYREHLARRRPDLIILAYGTNEAGDAGQPIEIYAADLRKVVSRIRRVVPQASCLLVGPSDRPDKSAGKYFDRPRTAQIIATQREVSREYGCGFFDLVSFMGGPLSMLNWCNGDPPLGAQDHVHFTHRGYEALGNVLHDALLLGYDTPSQLVFGPRPIAPPGSTISELKRNERDRHRDSTTNTKTR